MIKNSDQGTIRIEAAVFANSIDILLQGLIVNELIWKAAKSREIFGLVEQQEQVI